MAPSKPWILVSPASRGLGHALARHLLRTTTLPVLATARADPDGVKASILQDLYSSSSPSPSSPADARQQQQQQSSDDHDDTAITKSSSSSSSPAAAAAAAAAAAERLHVCPLDVTDESSVEVASRRAAELFPRASHHLHVGFALPGVLRVEKSPRQVDYDAALETLRVNTLGPLMLMKWFGDFLPRRATRLLAEEEEDEEGDEEEDDRNNNNSPRGQQDGKVAAAARTGKRANHHAVFVAAAARVGSTSDNRAGGWYTYRASKAGVISLARTFDLHLASRAGPSASAVAYHPGTVATDFSRGFWAGVPEGRLLSPAYAAERLAGLADAAARDPARYRGRCWDWEGEEVPP